MLFAGWTCRQASGCVCPGSVSDLVGHSGRGILAHVGLPEPCAETLQASLEIIDDLDARIAGERDLRRLGASHLYVSLSQSVPGA